MKENLLKEEIKKSLRLMGILNEAASSTLGKDIIKALFKNLLKNDIDNIVAKIEAQIGKKLAGGGLSAIEGAIGKSISRKEAVAIIIDTLGKSSDEVVSMIETNAPQFFSSLEAAAKNKKTRAEFISAFPNLNDFPEDVVNSLLKKAGATFGDKITIRELIGNFSTQYPELFKSVWFKEFKNDKVMAQLIKDADKAFTGKNLATVLDDLKIMMDAAEANIEKLARKKKISQADALTFKSALKKVGDVLNPIHYKTLDPTKVDWFGTGKQTVLEGVILYSLYRIGKSWYETGSPFKGIWNAGKDEFNDLTSDYKNDNSGISSFLTKTFPSHDIKRFKIIRNSDTQWDVTYNDGSKVYGPFKYAYEKGTFVEK
jgi:hypothetical protein